MRLLLKPLRGGGSGSGCVSVLHLLYRVLPCKLLQRLGVLAFRRLGWTGKGTF